MAKIYRVIQIIKFNLFNKISFIRPLAYQQSVFKRYRSAKHFSDFFLSTRWRQKSTGIDMKQS